VSASCLSFASSFGGLAYAANLPAAERANVLAALRDHLPRLVAESNAIAAEAQFAPVTPWLYARAAPKVNPLIFAGFDNTDPALGVGITKNIHARDRYGRRSHAW
jgi:hypothetical protein